MGKIRFIFLFTSAFLFFSSAYSVLQHWNYKHIDVDVAELLHAAIKPKELDARISHAIAEDRLEDAKMYLAIAQAYNYPLRYSDYQAYLDKHDTDLRRLKKGISSFTSGFVTGQGNDASGIGGAVVSDFTVIGDARDLFDQYQIHSRGEEVNELIVGLAGAGIGLTALTYGAAGSGAMVKSGTSVFKLAAKTGRLSRRFSDELMGLSRRVFDWRLFKQSVKQSDNVQDIRRAAQKSLNPAAARPFKVMAKQVNGVRKNTSLTDTLDMMRYVDTTSDLRRLEKFTAKHRNLSKGLLRLLGRSALGTVRVLRRTTALMLSLLGSVISGLFTLLGLFSFRKKQTPPG